MPELLTFANYSPLEHGLGDLYKIGANEQHRYGVAVEMSSAFGHELQPFPDVDNLGELIGKVGPGKELQSNIEGVREVLGTVEDATGIARGWSMRSGLLVPVERSFMTAELDGDVLDLAVMSGAARNWMKRREARLVSLNGARPIDGGALLVGGNRLMKAIEGDDVEEGMTEADYQKHVLAPQLGELGIATTLLRVDSGVGDDVMKAAAEKVREMVGLAESRITVVSNAAAWPQNAGQFRRAARSLDSRFDMDANQLVVVSDEFALGTGEEPTSTHQNPFSAIGQIARNLQEFARHSA